VTRLEDGAGGLYLCQDCYQDTCTCQGCGSALADFLIEDHDPTTGYRSHMV
jgi:hypothetical protein